MNTGTKEKYEFKSFTNIKAAGSEINHSSAIVHVANIDNDGLFDLLCTDMGGYVYFYKNIGKKGAPSFTTPTKATSDGKEIKGSALKTTPFLEIVDWNEDGVKDLLIGFCYGGKVDDIRLYLGEGTTKSISPKNNTLFSGGLKISYKDRYIVIPNNNIGNLTLTNSKGQIVLTIKTIKNQTHYRIPYTIANGLYSITYNTKHLNYQSKLFVY